MQDVPNRPWIRAPAYWAELIVVPTLLLAGCNSPKPPVYQDKRGFRFTPPPGWVERARDDALPARVGHGHKNVPLPPLGVPGKAAQERLLVRYDRLAPGKMAWLRVTVADVSLTTSLKACLANRSPEGHWKRESEEENLEMSGLPAARVAFAGRWDEQDYLCETVAVRRQESVYFITASFPLPMVRLMSKCGRQLPVRPGSNLFGWKGGLRLR